MIESLESIAGVNPPDAEYHRLLGYPRNHELGDRARELSVGARSWFAEHGRPWVYLREAALDLSGDSLRLDGVEFRSAQLRDHLTAAGATRALLLIASAGHACEDQARQLWQDAKPDEYFFLEIFGSAIVEQLVATASSRICALAESDGLVAIRHYSPGYAGWDVADQNQLFAIIARAATRPFPEPLEVLSSGMLRPKKSLLGVVGLTGRTAQATAALRATPCEACSYSPCRYRRAAYRPAAPPASAAPISPSSARASTYTVNPRALQKWARDRVRLTSLPDGSVSAAFRFDGTTCSNMGRPLAFDYSVTLASADAGFTILDTDCRPAPDDEGHKLMCAYLADAPALMQAIATEKPLLGQPLDAVLQWDRRAAPSGCHCDAASRAHKWGLAFEAIHFTLSQRIAPATADSAHVAAPAFP